jgi:hypothetical protein
VLSWMPFLGRTKPRPDRRGQARLSQLAGARRHRVDGTKGLSSSSAVITGNCGH